MLAADHNENTVTLTHYHTIPTINEHIEEGFENTEEKGENAGK